MTVQTAQEKLPTEVLESKGLSSEDKELLLTDILNSVMIRIENQLLVPAVYTLKLIKDADPSVHVFLHGSSASHFSNMSFIWDIVSPFEERVRQENALTDYFLSHFIRLLKNERECEAVGEVMVNLEYVYDQKAQVKIEFDEETRQEMVTFFPFKPEYGITMPSYQLEQEYNNCFLGDDNVNVLADLADLTKSYNEHGLEETIKLAEKIGRNIIVSKSE